MPQHPVDLIKFIAFVFEHFFGRAHIIFPFRHELLTTYLSVEVGASCFIYHGAFSEETVSYVISTGVNSGGSRPMYGIRSGK